jgi:hypothetical protein
LPLSAERGEHEYQKQNNTKIHRRKEGKEMVYRVIYGKEGFPMAVWKKSEHEATKFAREMRRVGYDVSVYAHDAAGARRMKL